MIIAAIIGVTILCSSILYLSDFDEDEMSFVFDVTVVNVNDLANIYLGGRNSSVGSVWACCPQRRRFDPPLGTFSGRGDFPLELTWVQTPFPKNLFRMRV